MSNLKSRTLQIGAPYLLICRDDKNVKKNPSPPVGKYNNSCDNRNSGI